MKQQLNLIDPRLLTAAARPSAITLVIMLGLAAVAVQAHYGWERLQLKRALAGSSVEPAAAAPVDDAASQAERALQALQRSVERDELLLDGLARASDLPVDSVSQLRQLAAALPQALWLTEVELSGRTGLRIAGGTLDVAALSGYAARLGEIAALKGRALQTLTLVPQRPEPANGAAAEADALPPHHLFVLASGEPQTTAKDTR
ncbi:MAG: hypothetical protein AD742_06385 [Methylibium sp. NZG]|nr:MAG: hypothetical protein AD742_06385 [Methylibium sp. NZG]